MSQFSIDDATPAKITSVNLRSERHGEDHVPAVDIGLQIEIGNAVLSNFDGALLRAMYCKDTATAEGQAVLEGMAPELSRLTTLAASVTQPLKLAWEGVGYTLVIDRGLGLGSASTVRITDAKINGIRAHCKDGGTVTLTIRVQASGLEAETLGRLGTMVQTEADVIITAPGSTEAFLEGGQERG